MKGELAALCAALLWAFASLLFADIGRHIRAINLNVFKGVVALFLMGLTLCCGSLFGIEELQINTVTTMSNEGFFLLFFSGIIGIGAGDTAYFACLRRIGPQRGLMLESTAPIIAALLALALFQEFLDPAAWTGIVITTFGVILVVRCAQSIMEYNTSASGVLFGILAAVCQASGIVLSRKALLLDEVQPLASGVIRLLAALLVIVIWLVLRKIFRNHSADHQPLTTAARLLRQHGHIARLAGAITLGTFLAIWLMQISVKFTSAGITQTLLATSPLFGMLMGLGRGQSQPPLVWLGLGLSICGVSLLFVF